MKDIAVTYGLGRYTRVGDYVVVDGYNNVCARNVVVDGARNVDKILEVPSDILEVTLLGRHEIYARNLTRDWGEPKPVRGPFRTLSREEIILARMKGLC